jgi:hypothetical protein
MIDDKIDNIYIYIYHQTCIYNKDNCLKYHYKTF